MATLKDVEAYTDTVSRIEPDVHPLDQDGSHASIAVSLKRIADTLHWFSILVSHTLERAAETDEDARKILERLKGGK